MEPYSVKRFLRPAESTYRFTVGNGISHFLEETGKNFRLISFT